MPSPWLMLMFNGPDFSSRLFFFVLVAETHWGHQGGLFSRYVWDGERPEGAIWSTARTWTSYYVIPGQALGRQSQRALCRFWEALR